MVRQNERGRKGGQEGRRAAAKRVAEGRSRPRESGRGAKGQKLLSAKARRKIERRKSYARLVRKAKEPAQIAPWTLDESVDVERAAAAPATRSASSLPATPVWLATFQIRSVVSEETERQSRRAAR